jgi:hypothetical protein
VFETGTKRRRKMKRRRKAIAMGVMKEASTSIARVVESFIGPLTPTTSS